MIGWFHETCSEEDVSNYKTGLCCNAYVALSNESSVSAEPKFPSPSLSNAYQAGYSFGCAKIAICPPTPSSAIPFPYSMCLYVRAC